MDPTGGSCTRRARTVRRFDMCVVMGRFQAQNPPSKRAPKTSALARERQREKRQTAKSVKVDISDEDWQEAVDWLLRRRDESVRVCRGVFSQKSGTNTPSARQKEPPGSLPQAFGNPRRSGLWWASSPGTISRNIRKVPHRARTVRQHPLDHSPVRLHTPPYRSTDALCDVGSGGDATAVGAVHLCRVRCRVSDARSHFCGMRVLCRWPLWPGVLPSDA